MLTPTFSCATRLCIGFKVVFSVPWRPARSPLTASVPRLAPLLPHLCVRIWIRIQSEFLHTLLPLPSPPLAFLCQTPPDLHRGEREKERERKEEINGNYKVRVDITALNLIASKNQIKMELSQPIIKAENKHSKVLCLPLTLVAGSSSVCVVQEGLAGPTSPGVHLEFLAVLFSRPAQQQSSVGGISASVFFSFHCVLRGANTGGVREHAGARVLI